MIRWELSVGVFLFLIYTTTCHYHRHHKTSVLSFAPVVPVLPQYPPRQFHHRGTVVSPLVRNQKYRYGILRLTTINNNDIHNNIAHTDHNFASGFHWEYGGVSFAGTDPDRPTKINQDGSFFVPPTVVHPPLSQQRKYSITLFGAMDGHGKKGHEVVQFLQQQLPRRLQQYVERALTLATHTAPDWSGNNNPLTTSIINGAKHTLGNESFSLEEQKIELISLGHADPSELFPSDQTDDDNSFDIHMELAIVDAFLHAQYDLRQNPKVPSSRSGTTCVCCVLVEDHQSQQVTLYTANVGDSGVIAITCMNDNFWNAQSLTNSTTVKFQMERKRIESCDSRIDTSGNVFYGPIGIAMTRSLGNSVMLNAGVLPIPIITKQELPLSPSDLANDYENQCNSISYYICSGTDGIFDVLPNEKIMCMIQEGTTELRSCQYIATDICHAAKLAWLADLPIETKVDDCTFTILHLSHSTRG